MINTCPRCGQEIDVSNRIYLNLTHSRWKYAQPRRVVIIGNMDKKGNPQYNKERVIEYYEEDHGTTFACLKINCTYFRFPVDLPDADGPMSVIEYKGTVTFTDLKELSK